MKWSCTITLVVTPQSTVFDGTVYNPRVPARREETEGGRGEVDNGSTVLVNEKDGKIRRLGGGREDPVTVPTLCLERTWVRRR